MEEPVRPQKRLLNQIFCLCDVACQSVGKAIGLFVGVPYEILEQLATILDGYDSILSRGEEHDSKTLMQLVSTPTSFHAVP